MKPLSIILLISTLATIWGCKEDRKFPEPTNLSEFKKTEFLPTLEHQLSKDKNSIYAATLLFAWEEIRKNIEQPLNINKSFTDLTLLQNSKSFMNSLHPGEFSASGEVNGNVVRASAVFSKSLPFELNLNSFSKQLTFEGKKVASFGQVGHDYQTSGIIQILYYKDDDNFIIKLSPKDKEHEIILFKSDNTFKSMSEILPFIINKIEVGKKERVSKKSAYLLNDEDEVVIPKFKFNIDHNYTTIEGNTFSSANQEYTIETIYQRTAFILDESGAEVESESEVALEELEENGSKPVPKKMIFDKPFFLMLKRTDAKNPYFALWVNNAELMQLEEKALMKKSKPLL